MKPVAGSWPVDAPDLSAVERWMRATLGDRSLSISGCTRLSGGAIQQNWAIDVEAADVRHAWVLRCDAAAGVASSLPRGREYAALLLAHRAGVPVARPVALCEGRGVIGRPFFLAERLPGSAAGHRLTRDDVLVPDRDALAADLGRAMARLHAAVPDAAQWGVPPAAAPAARQIDTLRRMLDTLVADAQAAAAAPTIEWGLRWCERHPPAVQRQVFTHGDWRTGNYLVADGRLVGVLDWEFAGWGDPLADIGWLFARCWRFGRDDRRCGGVADAAPFLRAYEAEARISLPREQIAWWELLAHLRWAVIALQQAARHRSGKERSLELALTGHLVPGLELEVLRAIAGRAEEAFA